MSDPFPLMTGGFFIWPTTGHWVPSLLGSKDTRMYRIIMRRIFYYSSNALSKRSLSSLRGCYHSYSAGKVECNIETSPTLTFRNHAGVPLLGETAKKI